MGASRYWKHANSLHTYEIQPRNLDTSNTGEEQLRNSETQEQLKNKHSKVILRNSIQLLTVTYEVIKGFLEIDLSNRLE